MRQRVGRFFREWFRLILAGDDWSDRFLRWFVYVVAIGLSFLTAPIDITLRAFGHGPGMIEAPVGLVIVIVGLCLWIAVSAGIATRVAEELTLANPIFIGCETVPWRPLQNSLRSWCRFEVRNNGLRSPLRVRLMGVRPALQINGMGGPLEPMMSASSPTGEVTIDQGESQKFDLFMMIRWKFRMPRRMVRESGDPKNPKLIQWGPRAPVAVSSLAAGQRGGGTLDATL
jgi:hypothetical protein